MSINEVLERITEQRYGPRPEPTPVKDGTGKLKGLFLTFGLIAVVGVTVIECLDFNNAYWQRKISQSKHQQDVQDQQRLALGMNHSRLAELFLIHQLQSLQHGEVLDTICDASTSRLPSRIDRWEIVYRDMDAGLNRQNTYRFLVYIDHVLYQIHIQETIRGDNVLEPAALTDTCISFVSIIRETKYGNNYQVGRD